MLRHIRSPLAGKSISDLFPNREAWNRFVRIEAFKAALEVFRTLENDEFTIELWGHMGKDFFENKFSDPGGDDRKNFNRDLESRLGEAMWRFWAYAYALYETFLSEEATTQKKTAKEVLKNYRQDGADYKKAMGILLRLHKKGYIIYPYPLFITQNIPVMSGTLKAMYRKKQQTVFIHFMVGIPLQGLSLNKAADLLWQFLSAYLPAMIGDPNGESFANIDFIKKAAQRSPF